MKQSQTKLIHHPLAQHFVTELRKSETTATEYRSITARLTTILVLEATNNIRLVPTDVTTPLEKTKGSQLESGLVVIPILRAGLGMLDTIVGLFPNVSVGFIGLERDHSTAEASQYYCKLPELKDRDVLIVDPMLATGGSAVRAISAVEPYAPRSITLISIVAAPEGISHVIEQYPAVRIVIAAIDRELNSAKYILPGLGDFGDRLYGT